MYLLETNSAVMLQLQGGETAVTVPGAAAVGVTVGAGVGAGGGGGGE